jgi:hypothetical protein
LLETTSQDKSGIVDLLEESAYALVTKNEQFIVKFEGVVDPSKVRMAQKLQRDAFKINASYF